LVGGTLYSGRSWLILGRRRLSPTSSYGFFSVIEEQIHASTGRTWLFPTIGAGIGTRWRKGKDDGGGKERLIEAKERECGLKGLGRDTRKP
jgi:hypothetical protein